MASQPAHNEIVHTSMGAGRWLSAIMYLGTCRSLVRTMFVLCACTYCLLECVCVFAHICANTNAQIYHLLVYMEELVRSSVCICGHIWINYQFSLQFCSHKTCRKLLNIDCVLPNFLGIFSIWHIFGRQEKHFAFSCLYPNPPSKSNCGS